MIRLENDAFPFGPNRHELFYLDCFQGCAGAYCEGYIASRLMVTSEDMMVGSESWQNSFLL